LIFEILITYFSTLLLELLVSTFLVWIGGGDGDGGDLVLIKSQVSNLFYIQLIYNWYLKY